MNLSPNDSEGLRNEEGRAWIDGSGWVGGEGDFDDELTSV